MEIRNRVAVVTGATSGIGKAVAIRLASLGAKALALVDLSPQLEQVVEQIEDSISIPVVRGFVGDVTDEVFRKKVFDDISEFGVPCICVPAAGITKDGLGVKIKDGKAQMYPVECFRQTLEVDLIAPAYWAMETIARVGEAYGRWSDDDIRGAVVFIGSIISQGNKGQVAYSACKKGLEAVASTLTKEGMFYGVKCAVVHPGYTDTPMLQGVPKEAIEKNISQTQLKRLVKPEEIADAVCFMISNSAVTGQAWVDAGWHPAP